MSTDRRGTSPIVAISILFVLGAVVPLVVASHYGALDIPRSDDWSYLVTLFRWLDHGRLGFNDWVSMTLIGQLVITAPIVAVFGDSIRAVHVFSAMLGFAGLVGLYAIGCQLLPNRRGALLVAVTIAIGPLWAPLAATYMTDVPAFAIQMMALAVAVSAVRGPQLALPKLAAALGLGFVAISIRQYEVIPTIAVTLVAVWLVAHEPDHRRRLRVVLAMVGAVVIAIIALLGWWSSLPDSLSLSPDPQTSGLIGNLVLQTAGFLRLTGLLLVPVVVWIGPNRIIRRAWTASRESTVLLIGGVATWMLVTYLRNPAVPFVGNYVDRHGVLAEDVLQGRRPLVMPAPLFDVLVIAGSVAGILLALALVEPLMRLVERIRARDRTLADPGAAVIALTVAGFAAAYTIAIATKLPIFDRYALPAIPLGGLLLIVTMHRTPEVAVDASPATSPSAARAGLGITAVALILFAGVGLLFGTDSAAFDGARWRVDVATVHKGYSSAALDGGFEWIGFHRKHGPPTEPDPTPAERRRLKAEYFRGLCVDVKVDPRPRVVRRSIAQATMGGLGHADVKVVSVRNSRRCAK